MKEAFLSRYEEYEHDDILGRVYSCLRCGVFVKDTIKHDSWHEGRDDD